MKLFTIHLNNNKSWLTAKRNYYTIRWFSEKKFLLLLRSDNKKTALDELVKSGKNPAPYYIATIGFQEPPAEPPHHPSIVLLFS